VTAKLDLGPQPSQGRQEPSVSPVLRQSKRDLNSLRPHRIW